MRVKTLTMAAFLLSQFAFIYNAAGTEYLQTYYNFDETGTTIFDQSINAFNGTAVNSAGTRQTGIKGTALEFDGVNDYVDCGNHSVLDFGTGDFTVSVWIKPDSAAVSSIVRKSNNLSTMSGWSLVQNAAGYTFSIGDGTNRKTAYAAFANAGQWLHLVGVRSGDKIKLYINGILKTTTTGAQNINISSASYNTCIGDAGGYSCFDGLMDEIRIYNRALSDSEAQLQTCYNFDETGTTIFDQSINAFNGTAVNSAGTRQTGIKGTALEFDGVNDYVDCGNHSVLDFGTGDFTVSVWIKPDSAAVSSIVRKSNNLSTMSGWSLVQNAAGYTFSIGDGTNRKTAYAAFSNAGQWLHLVGVRSGDKIKLYINGVLKTTVTGAQGLNIASTSYNTYIGDAGGYSYFDGQMDEIRIISQALSDTEVTSLYQAKDLAGYWNFDEAGLTVYDQSYSGNDGTAVNSAGIRDAGINNTALVFDGVNDYVDCGNHSRFDFGTGNFTVSAWVKPDSCAARGIIRKSSTLSTISGWSLIQGADGYTFYIGDGNVNHRKTAYAVNTIPSDEWLQLTGTRDGDSVKLYINGVLKATASGAQDQNIASAAYNMYIGDAGGYECFSGLIDNVRVYNRALSDAETAASYQADIAGLGFLPAQAIVMFLSGPLTQSSGTISLNLNVTLPEPSSIYSLEAVVQNVKTLDKTTVSPAWNKTSGIVTISSSLLNDPGLYTAEIRMKANNQVVTSKTIAARIVTGRVLTNPTASSYTPVAGDCVLLTNLPSYITTGGTSFNYTFSYSAQGGSGLNLAANAESGFLNLGNNAPNHFCAIYLGVKAPWPEISTQLDGTNKTLNASVVDNYPEDANIVELFAGTGANCNTFKINSSAIARQLYYVRIVMLTTDENTLADYVNAPTSNKRVIYNNDGYSDFFGKTTAWTPAQLYALVDRYQDTDTETFEFTALATGAVNFSGSLANPPATYFGEGHLTPGDPVWANDDARKAAVFFRTMDTAGLPIFQSLITRSLSNGVPIWGSVRMGEWYPPVAGQTYYPFNGDVWSNHPEWRIKNRSGSYGTKMSLANGEIQQMIIGTLEKMVRMGCDGINLDFCRYPEVLGYETPLINGFMQQYPGVDPRILSSIDPRWIAYRCGVINGFISDVRTAMTAAGGSRTIKISVRLPATDFQSYGFEPQTWITNGWVDILIPHYPGNERDFDIQPWLDMIPNPNPNNIKIYPGITSDKKIIGETELTDAEIAAGVPLGTVIRMTDDDYRRKARQRNAADGVYIFNNWKGTGCLNLIGDKQYLKRWSYFEDPYNQPRVNATP